MLYSRNQSGMLRKRYNVSNDEEKEMETWGPLARSLTWETGPIAIKLWFYTGKLVKKKNIISLLGRDGPLIISKNLNSFYPRMLFATPDPID